MANVASPPGRGRPDWVGRFLLVTGCALALDTWLIPRLMSGQTGGPLCVAARIVGALLAGDGSVWLLMVAPTVGGLGLWWLLEGSRG